MRYIRCLVIGLLLFTLAIINTFAASIDYQSKTLANGIKLIYHVIPKSPDITVRFVVPAGFLTEPKNLTGISHLLEHLIYRGSSKYSPGDFHSQIDDQGGFYNGSTWMDYTEFYMQIPAEGYLDRVSMYLDMILRPSLTEKDVALEKKIVTVEKATRKIPGNISWLLLSQLTAGRFDYEVQAITREDLIKYHNLFYHLNRLTVIATGDFQPEALVKLLSEMKDDSQGDQPLKPKYAYNPADINTNDYLQGEKYTLLYYFDLKQLSAKELAVAKILPLILSYEPGNYDNLKDKPLDYGIALMNFSDNFFLFFIYRDCQEEYTPAVQEWHQQNLQRYNKFLKNKNFNKPLNQYAESLDRWLDMICADSFALNDYYRDMLFNPTAITQKDISIVRSLSSNDFKSFVSKYLDGKEHRTIVIKSIQSEDGTK